MWREVSAQAPGSNSTISKLWVISTPAAPSMIEAEQYFSADNSTARLT
jgi:hypothetical protein